MPGTPMFYESYLGYVFFLLLLLALALVSIFILTVKLNKYVTDFVARVWQGPKTLSLGNV